MILRRCWGCMAVVLLAGARWCLRRASNPAANGQGTTTATEVTWFLDQSVYDTNRPDIIQS